MIACNLETYSPFPLLEYVWSALECIIITTTMPVMFHYSNSTLQILHLSFLRRAQMAGQGFIIKGLCIFDSNVWYQSYKAAGFLEGSKDLWTSCLLLSELHRRHEVPKHQQTILHPDSYPSKTRSRRSGFPSDLSRDQNTHK